MEDKIPSHEQDADKCEISELKLYWNKCLDSERCDSIELNPVIRQQIQQNALRETEKTFPLTGQQLLNQYTLSPPKTRTQHNTFTEEYEHRIWILETQKTETVQRLRDNAKLYNSNWTMKNYQLLKVNKQWNQHFIYMKQTYENKVSELNETLYHQRFGEESVQQWGKVVTDQENEEHMWQQSKDKFTLELRNIKDENYILKKLNHVLRKRNDSYESEIKRLNKVLLQATTTGKINSISTTVNPSLEAMTSEDFKTKNEVLMQQVKIYEEDFKRERAEKEIIRKEKEELQQIVHKLRIQLQIKGRP